MIPQPGTVCGTPAERYLPLCRIPARMSRDGYAGENAKIRVPFYGYFFFNGSAFASSNSTIAQDQSRFMAGISKPNTFRK